MGPALRRRHAGFRWRRPGWLALHGLLCQLGCARDAAPAPAAFVDLGGGIEYATLRVAASDGAEGSDVHLLRLDPARAELIVVVDDHLSDAAGFRRAAGAVAAINGIYFDPQFKPLGLLVSQGRRLGKLRRVDHGVFTVAGGKPALQHARAYTPPEALEFAVECGPRLLTAGAPLPVKAGLARRTVIGSDRAGRVLLAASVGVLQLRDLTQSLAQPPSVGGAGAFHLLNLDGGSSTMFDLQAGRLRATIRSPVRVPVGIAVRARRAVGSQGGAGTAPSLEDSPTR